MTSRPQQRCAPERWQSGTVLVMALMFLVILTILGIAAVNGTSLSFRAVGNMQSRNFAISLAQEAIEQKISSSANFYTPVADTIRFRARVFR